MFDVLPNCHPRARIGHLTFNPNAKRLAKGHIFHLGQPH